MTVYKLRKILSQYDDRLEVQTTHYDDSINEYVTKEFFGDVDKHKHSIQLVAGDE